MRRWMVVAYLVTDATGRPASGEGSRVEMHGRYLTRWGARRAARAQEAYNAKARAGMNRSLVASGLAPMVHRLVVEEAS